MKKCQEVCVGSVVEGDVQIVFVSLCFELFGCMFFVAQKTKKSWKFIHCGVSSPTSPPKNSLKK